MTRTHYTYVQDDELSCETPNNDPSMTQPDQNLSIQDLLYRHSRGLPINANMHQGEFFDTEIPRITDLTDLQTHRSALEAERDQIDSQLKEAEKQKKLLEKEEKAKKATQEPSKDSKTSTKDEPPQDT